MWVAKSLHKSVSKPSDCHSEATEADYWKVWNTRGGKLSTSWIRLCNSESDEDYFLNHLTVAGIQKEDHRAVSVEIDQDNNKCKMDTRANCSVMVLRLIMEKTKDHKKVTKKGHKM